MIAARILPPEEWSKLERTQIPNLGRFVRPEDIAVVVVEDEGKVIACLSVLKATHFEGLWIDPERRNAGVVRSLLRQATAMARVWSNGWAFGGAADECMGKFLGRLNGVKLPMDLYMMPLGGEKCRQQL